MNKVAILGSVGVPAAYGGFETLAENLVSYHSRTCRSEQLVVYCSRKAVQGEPPATHLSAELRYIDLEANGPSSVPYDVLSLLSAVREDTDVILLLGVSGAVLLPLLRVFSRARIVTNIDGMEWKRQKWKGFARWWLRKSEGWAVRYSHAVVADNPAIAQYVRQTYGRDCEVIAYGGDHAISPEQVPYTADVLPEKYALGLCRIEPENNVQMILEAFADKPDLPLVFVGNWSHSSYAETLKRRFHGLKHVKLLDPVYDVRVLQQIRRNAQVYLHGHSAGGTNPSLVEMMHFGVPILAYDCEYNRFTTDNGALFFRDAEHLKQLVSGLSEEAVDGIRGRMLYLARTRYMWSSIGQQYFGLFQRLDSVPVAQTP